MVKVLCIAKENESRLKLIESKFINIVLPFRVKKYSKSEIVRGINPCLSFFKYINARWQLNVDN